MLEQRYKLVQKFHISKEMVIKRSSLKDLCYTPSEILETILIDINDQLYAQGSKYRVYLVKKFINFKIRVYYV